MLFVFIVRGKPFHTRPIALGTPAASRVGEGPGAMEIPAHRGHSRESGLVVSLIPFSPLLGLFSFLFFLDFCGVGLGCGRSQEPGEASRGA